MTDLAPHTIALQPGRLHLHWDDQQLIVDARLLRRNCRCTACRTQVLGGGAVEVSAELRLLRAELVGRYGLQLIFSDGHERGIYPWSYLHDLAQTA